MPGAAESPDDLLQEAKAIFPNTVLAKDFLSLEVSNGLQQSVSGIAIQPRSSA